MSKPIDKPPHRIDLWRTGEPVSARKLNRTVDAVNRIVAGVTPPKQRRGADVASAVILEVKKARVQSEDDDYIVCRDWDGSLGDEDIYVAKPPSLRRSE